MTQASGAAGLGLYLVKRIVDLLHGSITLSPEEQPGVVFEVEIPKA